MKHLVSPLLLMALSCSAAQAAPQSFTGETKRVTSVFSCPRPEVTAASDGFGALYGCIVGKAETVKLFINETPNKNTVENVKLIWNDWFRDAGFGVHADREHAERFARSFAKLYAPGQETALLKAFFANKTSKFESDTHRITYTYERGPSIDERLFVAIPK